MDPLGAGPRKPCGRGAATTVCARGRGPSGGDATKKVTGRKKHLLPDRLGGDITTASSQDRDGAKQRQPLAKVWADPDYSGPFVTWGKELRPQGRLHLEIVRDPKATQGFVVQPRRCVSGRSFARLTKRRRLGQDDRRLLTHPAAGIHWAILCVILPFPSRSWGLFQPALSPHR